jgi:hypothetical protein
MALEAAYQYLQRAVVHGTSTEGAVLVVLLLLLVISRLSPATRFSSKLQLPPSPPGRLPIIGHLHLIGAETHKSIRDLDAKHGRNGLMLLRLGAVPTLFVSSPTAAEAVLRTHDHVFASRPPSMAADIIRYGSTDVAFAPYGEYWRQGRKLLTAQMLSAKKVNSFRIGRKEEVKTNAFFFPLNERKKIGRRHSSAGPPDSPTCRCASSSTRSVRRRPRARWWTSASCCPATPTTSCAAPSSGSPTGRKAGTGSSGS